MNDPSADPAPHFWEISPGRQLAWNEFGDPAGKPVFYYHGWPSSRLQARLADGLARDRGLRLIAMDRPGMGRSTFEPARRLDTWPELMERFADHLGIGKFGQVGVSGGAPYVLACAAAMPDRLAGSAVLAGAVPLGEMKAFHGLHPIYRVMIGLKKLPPSVFTPPLHLAAQLTRANPGWPPMSWLLQSIAPEDRELLLGSPEIWPVIAASFREGIRTGGRGMMTDADVYFQPTGFVPTAITAPIHYWHGGDDRNIPLEMVRNFTDPIPGATLEVVEGAGHFSLVLGKAPAALDFLRDAAEKLAPGSHTNPQPT